MLGGSECLPDSDVVSVPWNSDTGSELSMLQAPATCCFFQASSALFIMDLRLRRRWRQYRNRKYSPTIVKMPKIDDTTMVPIKNFVLESRLRRSRRECGDIVGVYLVLRVSSREHAASGRNRIVRSHRQS